MGIEGNFFRKEIKNPNWKLLESTRIKHPSKAHTINNIACDLLALQEINYIAENITNNIPQKMILTIKERELNDRRRNNDT